MRIPDDIGMDLPECDAGIRTRVTRSKTMRLPDKLLKRLTAINAVFAQVKRNIHNFQLNERSARWSGTSRVFGANRLPARIEPDS